MSLVSSQKKKVGKSPYSTERSRKGDDSTLDLNQLAATEKALKIANATIQEYEFKEQNYKLLLSAQALGGDTSNDASLMTARLEVQNTIHSQKVRALLKSIEQLKEEVKTLKVKDNEHRRSQLIQELRKRERDLELVVDVLKDTLQQKVAEFQNSKENVNDYIIKTTLGGPRRFRPKSREEMENEMAASERKIKLLQETVGQLKDQMNTHKPSVPESLSDENEEQPIKHSQKLQVVELQCEIDRLQLVVETHHANLYAKDQENQRLHDQIKHFRQIEKNLNDLNCKYKIATETIDKLKTLESTQTLDHQENIHFKKVQGEPQYVLKNQYSQVAGVEQLLHLEQLQQAQQREIELETQLEELQKKYATERCRSHKQQLELNNTIQRYKKETEELKSRNEQLLHSVSLGKMDHQKTER